MKIEKRPKAVALMQPCYIPWLGHFHLWLNADELIWLDTFQYSRSSFHSRNRIIAKNEEGWQWLTVPITSHLGDSLQNARLSPTSNWRRKHVQNIKTQYARAPFLSELDPILEIISKADTPNLAILNMEILAALGKTIGIRTPTRCASTLTLRADDRSERVKELLTVTEATTYLVARGSVEYMKSDGGWDATSFQLKTQNFRCPPYPQAGRKEFVSHLSVVDALANIGPDGVLNLLRERDSDWLTFAEAISERKP